MSKVDPRRRAFLRGALLTRAGRAEEAKRQNPLGPLPPWHRGRALETHCSGCEQPCVRSCEPGIIRIHPEHHDYAGTPYLDFTAGGCTFCRACVDACPIEIEIQDPAPHIGKLSLNRISCIAWQDIICMSCSNSCQYKAITMTHYRRPQVNAQACTGCGMCVPACPLDAISVT